MLGRLHQETDWRTPGIKWEEGVVFATEGSNAPEREVHLESRNATHLFLIPPLDILFR
jgi:hypothetical protein